jgi:hypothetical protein
VGEPLDKLWICSASIIADLMLIFFFGVEVGGHYSLVCNTTLDVKGFATRCAEEGI